MTFQKMADDIALVRNDSGAPILHAQSALDLIAAAWQEGDCVKRRQKHDYRI